MDCLPEVRISDLGLETVQARDTQRGSEHAKRRKNVPLLLSCDLQDLGFREFGVGVRGHAVRRASRVAMETAAPCPLRALASSELPLQGSQLQSVKMAAEQGSPRNHATQWASLDFASGLLRPESGEWRRRKTLLSSYRCMHLSKLKR